MDNGFPKSVDVFEQLHESATTSAKAAMHRPLADLVTATLRVAVRSENTERSYTTAIGLFLRFLDKERGQRLHKNERAEWRPFARQQSARIEGRDKYVTTRTVWTFKAPCAVLRLVDAGLLDSFKVWREGQKDSAAAISTRLAAVRTFLAVALRDGILTDAQAYSMQLQAYQQKQTRHMEPVGRRLLPSEVKALREACRVETNRNKRDRTILDVMLYAGLRREEVATLNTANFTRSGGRWWILLTGRGKKKRRIKVHRSLFESLSIWLDAAGLRLDNGSQPLFYSVNRGDTISKRRLNNSAVGRLVAEWGYAAGLAPMKGENRLSPRDLRRTFARNAYDNGSDLIQVQTILGHSDPKTTAQYIGAFEDDDNTAVDYVRYY